MSARSALLRVSRNFPAFAPIAACSVVGARHAYSTGTDPSRYRARVVVVVVVDDDDGMDGWIDLMD